MAKSINFLKTFTALCFILLQVSNCWCQDLSAAVVKIYSLDYFVCSGALIRDNIVLTTNICLEGWTKPSEYKVIGNVNYEDAVKAGKVSSATRIYIPQTENRNPNYMDIAVMILERSIAGDNVRPTQLCSRDKIEDGTPITVYNFGLNKKSKRIEYNLSLKPLDLAVSNSSLCKTSLKQKFSETILCAEDSENMNCFYDRGCPVAVDGELCGVYSYGKACIGKGTPGSFTSFANPDVKQFINLVLRYQH